MKKANNASKAKKPAVKVRDLLFGAEGGEFGAGYEMVERLEGENLSACCQQELFHVLAADAKAASRNARNDLELLPPVRQRAD